MNPQDLNRELDAIESEASLLREKLEMLRDVMPETPLEAAKKAEDVGMIEERLGELYTRRKEIETALQSAPRRAPEVKPAMTEDDLTAEIKSITDELMRIEISMLKAEIDDDESEKQKLMMSASALKQRRSELVERMKELRSEQNERSPADLESRVAALEEENRRLSKELEEVRTVLSRLLQAMGVR